MFTGELRHKATSIISASSGHISRTDFAQKVFLSLETWYKTFLEKGLSAIIDAWRKHFTSEGKPIRVRSAQKTIEGTCLGVDNDGALLVRLPSGSTKRVLAGDIEEVAGAYGRRK
jgi:BirA family biotin operon repressor/biotin-[acetyl-CoA-carboxylase] ligase